MKKKKYLEFYEQCMETGFLPHNTSHNNVDGLCGNLGKKAMDLFEPTDEDCDEYGVKTWGYYARDVWGVHQAIDFGPTRQNIVLFLAAMNGEL